MVLIDISWDSSTGTDEYRIYRQTSSGVSTTSSNKIATVSSTTTSYTDDVPDEGEITYYYRITAVKIVNETSYVSEDSTEVSATVPKQSVGKIRDNGNVVDLGTNKLRINGSVVEIENAKVRINGSIVELQ